MPVFAEVGPLIMNKEIETKVTMMLDKGECIITSRIDSMNFPLKKEGKNYQSLTPMDSQIKIDENFLYLRINTEGIDKKNFNEEIFKHPLGLNFPYIKICRMTNNIYEIYFQEDQTIRMMAENNIVRDIIAVTLKMLCGQKILDHKFLDNNEYLKENLETPTKIKEKIEEVKKEENERSFTEENSNNNGKNIKDLKEKTEEIMNGINEHNGNFNKNERLSMEILMKIEQNAKEIAFLSQENEQIHKEKQHFLEEICVLKKEKEHLSTEIFNIKHNYMESLRENEQYKTNLEKFMNEKNFLLQDLDIYKLQIKENEENIAVLESKIKNLTSENEEKFLKKNNENEKKFEYEKEIILLKKEINLHEEQLKIKLNTIKELNQGNEDLENKVNYLMKKTESLKYETSKKYQSEERNCSEDEDVGKLQMQIVAFEKTIKELIFLIFFDFFDFF